MPRSGPGPRTSSPLSIMVPPSAGSKPPSMWRNVLLPQPDGPTIATNSPSCTVRSKFSSATTRLPCRLNTLASERTCNRAEDARVTPGAGLDADVANRAVIVLLIVLDAEFAKRRTAEQRGGIKQRRGQALLVAPAGGCAQRHLVLLETIWPEIV